MQMKIIELEISCLRGIKNLRLFLNQKNTLIYGDNGTGKSGVVDAIDFLVKGNISRLQGSTSLSQKEHGKHVVSSVSDAWVKAVVKLPQYMETIKIERRLSDPATLIVASKYKNDFIEIEKLSEAKPHFLTRKEILQFINSTDGDRAKEIERILDLKKLDDDRTLLMQLEKTLKQNCTNIRQQEKDNIFRIEKALLAPEPDWIFHINELRFTFSALEINTIYDEIIDDIKVSDQGKTKVTIKNAITELSKLAELIFNNESGFIKLLIELISIEDAMKKIQDISVAEKTIKLLESGLSLINDSICPLCKTDMIDMSSFSSSLSNRLTELKEVRKLSDDRKRCLINIKGQLQQIINNLERLIDIKIYDSNDILAETNSIANDCLNSLEPNVDTLTMSSLLERMQSKSFTELIDKITIILAELELNKADLDYKKLSTVSTALKELKNTRENKIKFEKSYGKSSVLYNAYIKSQQEYLNELYLSIQERFAELYRKMHYEDENDFAGTFNRKKTGLGFNVAFYDGNNYPPNAVHSEGHQDSMGICLFFALSEKITNDKLNLIVLDDVVMSIDIHHRKNFCNVLLSEFPNKQFVITTHDFIWRKELENAKVITRDNVVHFKNWDINHGPFVEAGKDVWDAIITKLEHGDKNEGIADLRYYLEETFSDICNKYRLKVPYSIDARWTLSDVFNPSYKFFHDAFKTCVASANSYGKDKSKQMQFLNEFESKYNSLKTNDWALNPSVHFTPWAQKLSLDELKQLANSFKEYCELFVCKTCKAEITINADQNYIPHSLSCKCGEMNFSCLKNS